jgi:hypothetical protein
VLNTVLDAAIDQGQKLHACFVDFQKAFDSVPRPKLWTRLAELGMHGPALAAVRAMYNNVQCAVRSSNGLSKPFPSLLGVKQGCPLSPLLFGLFIDPLESHLRRIAVQDQPVLSGQAVPCLMFADDVVLLALTVTGMQLLLQALECFCDREGLCVNLKKTKAVVFGLHLNRVAAPPQFIYRGQVLTLVEQFRYLGVEIHSTRGFRPGVEILCKSARRRAHSVLKRIHQLGIQDAQLKVTIFDALVKPILMWASAVWGPDLAVTKSFHANDPTEKVHRRFLKMALGVHESTTSEAVLGEFGRLPMRYCRLKEALTFLQRIQSAPPRSLVRLALAQALSLQQQRKHNWVSAFEAEVRELCGPRGTTFVVTAPFSAKELLAGASACYTVEMRGSATTKRATYAALKTVYRAEPYLGRLASCPRERRMLAKFRTGDYCLNAEKARRAGGGAVGAAGVGMCACCNSGVTEDVHHFIFQCPMYDDLRFGGRFRKLFLEYSSVPDFLNSDQSFLVGYFLWQCDAMRRQSR